MICTGHTCRQGRAICTEKCNEPRNEPYDSAADIASRLPLLILCTVLGCIAFAISAWMLLGDSGLSYALASLVRNLKSI